MPFCTSEGVTALKTTTACDVPFERRVYANLKGSNVNTILNGLHVAQPNPEPRDDIVRTPFIGRAYNLMSPQNTLASHILLPATARSHAITFPG